jgi:hypothetical protein
MLHIPYGRYAIERCEASYRRCQQNTFAILRYYRNIKRKVKNRDKRLAKCKGRLLEYRRRLRVLEIEKADLERRLEMASAK